MSKQSPVYATLGKVTLEASPEQSIAELHANVSELGQIRLQTVVLYDLLQLQ